MSIWTSIRYAFARTALKAAGVPFIPEWTRVNWLAPTFDRLARDGYKANAAVTICVTKLALAYQQPLPTVVDKAGALRPGPLASLLERPNPQMGYPELAIVIATYKAIGGRCLLHKVRNKAGQVIELYPYHVGQMRPVPGRYDWVTGYEYHDGAGTWTPVPKGDVIDLKWPTIDPSAPWNPIAPIQTLAREIDTDSEATRYVYALLMNDALPRTALVLPPGVTLTDPQHDRLKAQWSVRHGGDRRGGVALLEGGADIKRLALNMEELAFDALRRTPEARISAGFLIPPEVSGLTVGLEHSTYNNVSEARRGFFEDTITQLCTLDAGELTADLAAEFAGDLRVQHDYQNVVALQDNEDAKATRVYGGWDRGLLGLREARRALGLPEELPANDTFKSGMAALPAPEIIDVTPPKARPVRALKAAAEPDAIERRMQREVRRYLAREYARAAAQVEAMG